MGGEREPEDPPIHLVSPAYRTRRYEQLVPRRSLVEQLVDQPIGQLVVVTAPAGYGKTTTMALWDDADPRPFAWVGLDLRDDDPVHLVSRIAQAVSELEPLDPSVLRIFQGPGRSVELDMLPALGWGLRGRKPFVLVLDDVHFLRSPASWVCIDGLLGQLPLGMTLALVGRSTPAIDLARRRMSGHLCELTAERLAMDRDEAGSLLTRAGLDLDDGEVDSLVEQTEGWPGGLHLAALALAGHDPSGRADLFSGRDRLVADYLVEEVLASSPDDLQDFLLASSVLDRMSAELLDELLETETSGRRLADIERSGNLFLVALGRDGEWFRYHHLFGEMLRARLRAVDPRRAAELHARASRLLEDRGDIDGAVRHAVRANDLDRAADLVLAHGVRLAFGGHAALLGQWLELLGPVTCERNAGAIAAMAWHGLATVDFEEIQSAMGAAERLGATGALPDGSPSLAVAMAVVRAILAAEGLEGVLRDTQFVRDGGPPEVNRWWGVATGVRGTACSMLGRFDDAERFLGEGLGHVADNPGFRAGLKAHLALLHLYRDDLANADLWSRRALALADQNNLEGVSVAMPVYFVGALVAARSGRVAEARRLIAVGQAMLAAIGDRVHRTALFGNVLLGRAALALGDVAGARAFAHEAERARRRDGSALYVVAQLDALQQQLDAPSAQSSVVVTPLTPAEMRVLPYLATHLSLQQIAETLIISRNTAKSHSVAIYRKLGVSSRSDAVSESRRLGLIADPSSSG
jgi:LuxR family maltose regulon positive regulatory protein